jgi:hypothetical protein
MERYFEKFQTVQYANTVARNITQRAVFLTSVYNNPLFYYPYDIADGERPDMIADRYYSDQYMAWVINLSNKVIDPYHDWYLDQSTFNDFIVKKYGSLASAMTKIKHFRNNWYSDPTPTISSASYDSLDASLVRFYEPVPINGVVTPNPRQYTRRKEDWIVVTNSIARYSVANGAAFARDEVVDVSFSPSQTGTGQVTYANSSTVVLQSLLGTTTTGTISGSSFLRGRESGANTAFTAANSVANNIPAIEASYWSPVTYFEYETDINERNKSILVLKSQFAPKVARQLRDLLK